ncbi:MAG: DUF1622 domain-containing protein [Mycobacteriales bacterium]
MHRDGFAGVAEKLGLAIEMLGVAAIAASVVLAALVFLTRSVRPQTRDRAYGDTRRCLGRGILLGLELLVAGDIVRTVAVDPTFRSIGVLGLIVLIRTFLSFALEVELNGRWPWQQAPDRASPGRHPG